ncbi:MAG: hypothetical protein ACNS62_16545 [Candidatus Cyclobacteriaceae bacterium M3_2C_046]
MKSSRLSTFKKFAWHLLLGVALLISMFTVSLLAVHIPVWISIILLTGLYVWSFYPAVLKRGRPKAE